MKVSRKPIVIRKLAQCIRHLASGYTRFRNQKYFNFKSLDHIKPQSHFLNSFHARIRSNITKKAQSSFYIKTVDSLVLTYVWLAVYSRDWQLGQLTTIVTVFGATAFEVEESAI